MNMNSVFPGKVLWRGATSLLFGFFSPWLAEAGEVRINSFGFTSQRQFQVRLSSTETNYYILLQGDSAARITNAIAIVPGTPETILITEPPEAKPGAARFYQVAEVPSAHPLDTDRDGIDDVYELQHGAFLDPLNPFDAALDYDGDGLSNLTEYMNGTDPAGRSLTTFQSWPANGEAGVSVTREMAIEFSRPLSATSVVSTKEIYAENAGRRVLSRAELSADRRRVALFFLEPLAGGSSVVVTINGSDLEDDSGLAVDADGDGSPGGVGKVSYRTLSTVPVAGTAISGQVFAAELAAAGGEPASNKPLRGVTITVDGMEETLRATTDAQGRFVLRPVPAGRFFVHVDGRTSPESDWPNGAYYPFVGKMWEASAGRTNLANGTGEIFLPRVPAGTLQAVSSTEATHIPFAPSVLEKYPQLEGVQITVPANALFSDDGRRGGRVGIAPVPADRLPQPLPPGLEFPLVITIQTDGPSNFSEPVPVRFPNLPDPKTGDVLAPGAKSALWSFDHDTGRWEMQGPMTVSADGRFVETDPGVGVRQPGWHSNAPGTSPGKNGPKPACDRNSCFLASVMGASDCAMSFIPGLSTAGCVALGATYGGTRSTMDCMMGDNVDCTASIAANSLGVGACFVNSIPIAGNIAACGGAAFGIGKACGGCLSGGAKIAPSASAEDAFAGHVEYLEATIAVLGQVLGTDAWTSAVDPHQSNWLPASEQIGAILRELARAMAEDSPEATLISQAEADHLRTLQRPTELPAAVLESTIAYWNRTVALYRQGVRTHRAAGRSDFMDRDQAVAAFGLLETAARKLEGLGFLRFDFSRSILEFYQDLFSRVADGDETAASGESLSRLFFALEDVRTGIVQRGRLEPDGSFGIPWLRPEWFYRVQYYDPETRNYGVVSFLSAETGRVTRVPPTLLYPVPDETDSDQDGLTDLAEGVIGTHPGRADSDGDGISDLAELLQGTNPLDGFPLTTGVVASVETRGYASDVYVTSGLAVVADGPAGVSIIGLGNRLQATWIQQLVTGGDARAVAGQGTRVAVASGSAGLLILDVSTPGDARIVHRVDLNGSVRSVAIGRNLVFAGFGNRVALVHLFTGEVVQNVAIGDADRVQDLAFRGNTLYVWAQDYFRTYELVGNSLRSLGVLAVQNSGTGTYRPRLSLNEDLAYAGWLNGYYIFDIRNPAAPVSVVRKNLQSGWKQLVPLQPDLGLAATGPLNADSTRHNLSLFQLSPNGTNTQFLLEIATPGPATALAVHRGMAYVADGPLGFHVVNYLPFDTRGQGPIVTLTSSATPEGLVENSAAWATAQVRDDAQIREVEFYIDGVLAGVDSAYPFELGFRAPAQSPTRRQVVLRAKATDTGLQEGWSEPIVLPLLRDTNAPAVLVHHPRNNGSRGVESLTSLVARFSEALTPGSITPASFRLFEAGQDGEPGTADDITIVGNVSYAPETFTARMTFAQPLPPGRYRAALDGRIADLGGTPMDEAFSWDFMVALFDITDDTPFEWAGTLNDLNNTSDSFSFRANAGQTLYFEETIGHCASSTRWSVVDPEGHVLVEETMGGTGCGRDAGLRTIASTGIHSILVTNSSVQPTPYRFKVWSVPEPDRFPISIGSVVSNGAPAPGAGNLEIPGARDIYTFEAAAGQSVYFDEQSGDCSSQVRWRCEDAAGEVLFDERLGGLGCGTKQIAGGKLLARGGTYTITVYGDNRGDGPYRFQLWDLPPPDDYPIQIGDRVGPNSPGLGAGSIETPGCKDIYRFQSSPGQAVYFQEITGTCTSLIRWKCVDGSGAIVFDEVFGAELGSCGTDAGVRVLERGGDYTITVEGDGAATGTYAFKIWPAAVPQEFEIPPSILVRADQPEPGAGRIESPGAVDIYRFTVPAGTGVRFEELSGNCQTPLEWWCEDEVGTAVFNRRTMGCGTAPGLKNLTRGGVYTIVVRGKQSGTGEYSFRLN